ncbi:MAG: hypothetical protein ACYDBV_12135 [Nitrospiria bacterium]
MKENIGYKLPKETYEEVREAILKQEVMPSMRLMWAAGDAARETNVCAYNCSFVAPSKLKDFGEIMYLSMCGTGVGFSVESQTAQALPQIKKQNGHKKIKHVVDDSKQGWADAFVLGLKTWFDGRDIEFDYSQLRPMGERLKTMGGKSSGPEPLMSLVNFTREKILRKQGRHLSNADVHDIVCKIGEIVVSGGVRRSALISLSDLDDYEMRHAKDGQFFLTEPQRSLANNSAVYLEKPTEAEFVEEWLSLMKSGSGERGIFNRGSLQKQMPERRWKINNREHEIMGTNPCIVGSSIIAVADGRNGVSIRELAEEGKDVPVYSYNISEKKVEIKWARNPRKTAEKKEIWEVVLDDGSVFRATADHKILKKDGSYTDLSELRRGESLVPFNSFSSNGGYRQICGVGEKMPNGHRWNRRQYRVMHEFYTGMVTEKGYHTQHLKHDKKDDKIENLKDMSIEDHQNLHSCHMHGKDNPYYKMSEESRRKFILASCHPGERNGRYSGYTNEQLIEEGKRVMKKEGRLTPAIWRKYAQKKGMPIFFKKGFRFNSWKDFMSKVIENHKVESVHYIGYEDVYNITVDDNHNYFVLTSYNDLFINSSGICVKNCGEINLRSKEFCNLSEIVARSNDTEETLLKKTIIATIIGTYQSTLTNFGYLSKKWKDNCEEERLLGVSITGQWDCPAVRNPSTLKKMRELALRTNIEYAKKLKINPSVSITCVKPSGTVSQLVDSSSGMHPRHAEYYIRRVRISATDSLFKMLRDQGVPYQPEVGQKPETANTFVFEFPIKSPKSPFFKDTISAIEQLEYWKMVKVNFTEHNPSVTVSIGDDEWLEVANWLYKNWDIVGGLSFLPREKHVYRLAPYETITKEKYEELSGKFPAIDFSKIIEYEKEDETKGAHELACQGGVCSIDDVMPVS